MSQICSSMKNLFDRCSCSLSKEALKRNIHFKFLPRSRKYQCLLDLEHRSTSHTTVDLSGNLSSAMFYLGSPEVTLLRTSDDSDELANTIQ